MQSFKVSLRLSNPVVVTEPIMLDSVLAWCAVNQAGGNFEACESLPLEERENAGLAYWAASQFFFEWRPALPGQLAKRIPVYALMRYGWNQKWVTSTTHLSPGSGQYKTFHDPIRLVHVPHAVAFGVGDIDRVRGLLGSLRFLGPKSRAGYGRIASCTVEPFPHDWSESVDDEATRPTPACAGQADGIAGYRPPYWMHKGPVRLPAPGIPEKIRRELAETGIPE